MNNIPESCATNCQEIWKFGGYTSLCYILVHINILHTYPELISLHIFGHNNNNNNNKILATLFPQNPIKLNPIQNSNHTMVNIVIIPKYQLDSIVQLTSELHETNLHETNCTRQIVRDKFTIKSMSQCSTSTATTLILVRFQIFLGSKRL